MCCLKTLEILLTLFCCRCRCNKEHNLFSDKLPNDDNSKEQPDNSGEDPLDDSSEHKPFGSGPNYGSTDTRNEANSDEQKPENAITHPPSDTESNTTRDCEESLPKSEALTGSESFYTCNSGEDSESFQTCNSGEESESFQTCHSGGGSDHLDLLNPLEQPGTRSLSMFGKQLKQLTDDLTNWATSWGSTPESSNNCP